MHKIRKKCLMASFALLPCTVMAQTNGVWTLQNCIDYAVAHNVQLLKSVAAEQSASVDVAEARRVYCRA